MFERSRLYISNIVWLYKGKARNLLIAADRSTFKNFATDRSSLDNFFYFTGVMVFIVDCFNKTMLI